MSGSRMELPDRTSPDDLSPVWRMLAGGMPDEAGSIPVPVVCALSGDAGAGWRDLVTDAVVDAGNRDATLIVAVQRPWSRLVLDLLARRRPNLRGVPSPTSVRRHLESAGSRVEGVYTLWPSIRFPRVAFPTGHSRVVVWAQRSGVLGGGGNRRWARLAARSWLFTPLAILLSPGVAFVARPGGGDA